MPNDHALPPGVEMAQDQQSRPITNLSMNGQVQRPELEGIACSIQHPLNSGKGPSPACGLFGAGVITTPEGPKIMAQMKHADGTSLAALLNLDDAIEYRDIFVGVVADALKVGS